MAGRSLILLVAMLALVLFAAATDHYQTLEVPRTASKSEIRSAFQKLSKQWYAFSVELTLQPLLER